MTNNDSTPGRDHPSSEHSQPELSTPELSIIVPTFNEVDNVAVLADKISTVLEGENWEIIFVDDNSPDQTYNAVKNLGEKDPRIKLIHRIGRTGLSSACLEGFVASSAPFVGVIDADLQHDENLLKEMLVTLRKGELDLIVASRKIDNGSFGQMPNLRIKISELATWATQKVLKVPLTDPMSGFFMLKKSVVDDVQKRLYGRGFKILLDICSNTSEPLKIGELPYHMRARVAGESKLGFSVVLEYMLFLFNHILGNHLPLRFLKFCLIGGSGVLLHLAVLGILYKLAGMAFLYSQIVAVAVAMTSNYILNNRFTFKEVKRTGARFWSGMINFYIICTVGALLGVSIGQILHDYDVVWWLAGFSTTLVAAIWNFSVSTVFTWRNPNR